MATTTCGACGAAVAAGDEFCESCGAPLTEAAVAAAAPEPVRAPAPETAPPVPPPSPPSGQCACGGAFGADGWCETCGAPAPKERDHWAEQPAPWVAGVCDRGIRHTRNEDAMALLAEGRAGSFCALVVCDGVTTATDSDVAALAAARAARDALAAARLVTASPSPSARIVHWTDAVIAAAADAQEQAVAVAADVEPGLEPPSCTFVSCVVDDGVLVAGWVGDSRAYWLPDVGPAAQLTTDHSWATGQIALGMDREAAEAAPESHGITRWLGIDAPDAVPECSSSPVEGGGWVLVCSDGLWNYCSTAADLRSLVASLVAEHGTDPATLAARLVDFANGKGGIDNVTAALARLDP